MYYYRLYEMNIESDLLFRQLYSIEKCTPDVVIKAGVISDEILALQDDPRGYVGDRQSIYVHPAFNLLIEDGKSIVYQLKDNVDQEFIKALGREFTKLDLCQWILGVGVGLLALQRGMISMHCSAMSKDGQAIIVCGQSGAGKSTISSQLLKDGWKLMADDVALVEYRDGVTYVKPAFPYQKLCRDIAIKEGYNLDKEIYIDDGRDKFMVKYRGDFSTEAKPLKHMIYMALTDKDELIHQELTGLDAFYAILNNMYIFHMLGEQKYQPEIVKRCMKVASSITVDAIVRPAKGGTLTQEIETIKKVLN